MTSIAAGEAASYPAAELERRFYAFAIDRLLAWGLFAGGSYLAWRFFLDDGAVLAGVGVVAGTVVVVSLAYATLLGVAGISPGKAAVGLRVVRPSDGRPIGLGHALLRTVVLGAATLPTFGLGIATLAWTAVADPTGRRRGAHDRWAGTTVVDVRPAPLPVPEQAQRPRQIVNLTAMRLMPAPPADQIRVPARASRPATSPPSAPPLPSPQPPPPWTASLRPASPDPEPRPAAPRPPPAPSTAPPRVAAPPLPRHAGPALPEPVRSAATTPPTAPARSTETPTVRRPAQTPGGPGEAVEPSTRWRVTFDTGETFVVGGLALVGRSPEPRAGEPVIHLVALRSTDMSLSKTHAQFQVVPDGALVVMDRGSTNGSVVVRRGVPKGLSAGRPATLIEGDTVRFGDRTMTVSKASR